MRTERDWDNIQESYVGEFLHKYFYKRLSEDAIMITDNENQNLGIDEIINGMLIDNKAQSSKKFIGDPRPTFILELLTNNKNNKEIPGWFVNGELSTTHYAFVWIRDSYVDEYGRIACAEDINKLEIMIVDKAKLKQSINSIFSDEELVTIAKAMKSDGELKRHFKNIDTFSATYSAHLREQPVTLVAKKYFLKRFATHHYIVTPENTFSIM